LTWRILFSLGAIHRFGKTVIRVNGNEHPPVHAHVNHPEGPATVYLNGAVKNSGVPVSALASACRWIREHPEAVIDEWDRCN
jgi:hypothetical protein